MSEEYLSKRELMIIGPRPPVTKKEFMARLWSLNPSGNVEDAYINTCYAISSQKQFNGDPITFDLIVSKYTAYLQRERVKETEARFIRSVASFITKGGFNEHFEGLSSDVLNRYLG